MPDEITPSIGMCVECEVELTNFDCWYLGSRGPRCGITEACATRILAAAINRLAWRLNGD